MDENTIDYIETTDIPRLLKDYFLRNVHSHLYINNQLINNIEDLYIELDSFYEFDDVEFCAIVINGIKKQEKHNYFYHYLKKVIDNSMKMVPKSSKFNQNEVVLAKKLLLEFPENEIVDNLKRLSKLIEEYQMFGDDRKIYEAHILIGKLQILIKIYPYKEHIKVYKRLTELLLKKIK